MPAPAERDGVVDAPAPVVPASDTWRARVGAAATTRGIPLGTIITTVLVAVAVLDLNALAVLLLWTLRSLLLNLTVALFLAILLSPPVRLLERRGFSRAMASVTVVLIGLALFAGIVYLFTAPLLTGVTRLDHELPTLVSQAEHGRGWLGHLIQRLHLQRFVNQNLPKLSHDITSSLKPAQAFSVGAAALSTVITLSVIAITAFFLLLEAPRLWGGFLRLLPPARAARVSTVYTEASRSVTGYMLGNFLTSVIAGIVVLITLSALGVPFAGLLAVWVALVDLLPLVGGLLAGVPVVLIALLHSEVAALVAAIVFLLYQTLENHLLNPIIMSRTVRLNPLWVLLSVLIGATLGGRIGAGPGTFVGALLGIPIGGGLQVVVRELRRGADPADLEPMPAPPVAASGTEPP